MRNTRAWKQAIDEQGRIEGCNPAAGRLFGYSPSELRNQNVSLLMPEPHRSQNNDYLARYLKTWVARVIEAGPTEVVGVHKDGSPINIRLGLGVADLGNRKIFIGLLTDITWRIKVEEQLRQSQKIEGLGQLAGGIAHDFNNLLTVALGNLQLLEGTLKDRPEALGMLRDASKACWRGADLCKRLLAFSRRQKLSPESIEVNKLVAGMEILLRRTLGNNIDIRLESGSELSPITADPGQLHLDPLPEAGFAFINKPFRNAELAQLLRQTLDA